MVAATGRFETNSRMANPLQSKIATTAFAFRGYNIDESGPHARVAWPTRRTGRRPPLLAARQRNLRRTSSAGRSTWSSTVSRRDEPGLDHYAEAVALIVAADLAQVQLLEEFHGVRYREAKLAYGYSLGELSAVACGGVFDMAEVLQRADRDGGRLRGAGGKRDDGRAVFARPGDR